MARPGRADIEVFTTCPPSSDVQRASYVGTVRDIARWSEEAGCTGILVYSDNRLVDPWIVSQLILQATTTLLPLVAVQPLYLHPLAAAKTIATIAQFYERRLILNMVAGGFKNDLVALNDETAHDARYDRVVEYAQIVQQLLPGDGPVTFRGRYYRVTNLRLKPEVPEVLRPGFFISGSSEAGVAAARTLGATAVKYPRSSDDEENVLGEKIRCGIRVGIVTRETSEEAWAVARARFPADRRGQIAHSLAMKISDSRWHRQLSELGEVPASQAHPYWLGPFENYKTFCPYLVGSYDVVAGELARYIALGFRTFILDIPASREELDHINLAMAKACDRSTTEIDG